MKCIQCKVNIAQWRECGGDTPRVYCTRACQRAYHYQLTGLKIAEEGVDDPQVIGLESGDGIRVRFARKDAVNMVTIAGIVKDAGPDDYIPVPNISGRALQQIKLFIDRKENFDRYEARRLARDEDTFYNLLLAANFLDYQVLLHALMPIWIQKPSFPGPYAREMGPYIQKALYFYLRDDDFASLNVSDNIKQPFRDFIRWGFVQWNIRMATKNGELLVVDRLLRDELADPTAEKNFPLEYATYGKHWSIVKRLWEDPRVATPVNRLNLLQEAVRDNQTELLETLLDDDRLTPQLFDVGWHDNHLLKLAAEFGHFETIQLLLKYPGVDPSAGRNYVLRMAAILGNVDIVNLLLKDIRVDASFPRNDALYQAIEHHHLAVVERLLKDPMPDLEVLTEYLDDPDIRAIYEAQKAKRQRRNE